MFRVDTQRHACRLQVSIVAVDAGPVNLRVAQPAHFGVNEVFTSLQQVRAMAWTVQPSARRPAADPEMKASRWPAIPARRRGADHRRWVARCVSLFCT